MKKFDNLIKRLTQKVEMSATPVTGFIVGLSGTDSIATFILLAEVAKEKNIHVTGLHYMEKETVQTIVTRELFEWLEERYDNITLEGVRLPQGNIDAFRWADMHNRALERRHWVVSTVNATEQALGTYSILAKSASIAPITTLYKGEVLKVCAEYGVPEWFSAKSRIPDCICGRDEFAAANIELIDDVIRSNLGKDYPTHDIRNAMDYIRDKKTENGFKSRTPYTI